MEYCGRDDPGANSERRAAEDDFGSVSIMSKQVSRPPLRI